MIPHGFMPKKVPIMNQKKYMYNYCKYGYIHVHKPSY